MREKKIQTGLRLPAEQHDRVTIIANRTGTSVNAVIALALDIGLTSIEHQYQSARGLPHNPEDIT